MHIFERDCKINFVDDNNVFVGFDYESSCCEDFSYKLTLEKPTSWPKIDELPEIDGNDFPGFNFNTGFYVEFDEGSKGDGGGAVVFKLKHKDGRVMFLSLQNTHNGYYSHGFEMTKDGKIVHSGSL